MFKICVIGCGNMSLKGHGPAMQKYAAEHADTCLAACCDVNEERAKDYAERFGFNKWYTDYVEMLDNEKPDAVSLVSPVHLTKPLSIDIMNRGYHVILEKPPGLNCDELKEMIETAKKAGVFVRTSFNRRYLPLVVKLKELLKGKRIFNITYEMYRYSRDDLDFATTAIHAIDAAKSIVGSDYQHVDLFYKELPDIGEKVACYNLNCRFESGALGQIAIIPMGGTITERITVNTDNETYYVNLPIGNNMDSPGRLLCLRLDEVIHDISGEELVDTTQMFEVSGFYEENRGFFEMIRNGGPVSCDLESGMQSVELANRLRSRAASYDKE